MSDLNFSQRQKFRRNVPSDGGNNTNINNNHQIFLDSGLGFTFSPQNPKTVIEPIPMDSTSQHHYSGGDDNNFGDFSSVNDNNNNNNGNGNVDGFSGHLSSSYEFYDSQFDDVGDDNDYIKGSQYQQDQDQYQDQGQYQQHQQQQQQHIPTKPKRRRSRKTVIPGRGGSSLSFGNGLLSSEDVELLNSGSRRRNSSKITGLKYLQRISLERQLAKQFSMRRTLTPPSKVQPFFYAQSTTIIKKISQLCKKTGLPFFMVVGYPNISATSSTVSNDQGSSSSSSTTTTTSSSQTNTGGGNSFNDDETEDTTTAAEYDEKQQQQQQNDNEDESSSSRSTNISAFVASSVPAEYLSQHFSDFVVPAVNRIVTGGMYTSQELAKRVIDMKEKLYMIEQNKLQQHRLQQQQQSSSSSSSLSSSQSKLNVNHRITAKLEMEYMCPGLEMYWESMKKKKSNDVLSGDLAPCVIDQNSSQEAVIMMIESKLMTEDEAQQLDESTEFTTPTITSRTISPKEHQELRNSIDPSIVGAAPAGNNSMSCIISSRPANPNNVIRSVMGCEITFISPLERISGK